MSIFRTARMTTLAAVLAACWPGMVWADGTAHWCFEERAGTVTADHVGGNDADLVDADPLTSWVPGNPDAGIAALELNGDGGYLNVQDPDAYDFGADFTWAAFIKTDDEEAGTIIARSPGPEEYHAEGSIILFVAEGAIFLDIGFIDELVGGFVADGEWHFVAVTVAFNVGPVIEDDVVGDLVTLYFDDDAVSRDDWDIEEFGPLGGDGPITIGAGAMDFPSEENPFYVGLIDDVRFWDSALDVGAIFDALDAAGDGCVLNPPVCPSDGEAEYADTSCDALIVEAPAGGVAGLHTFTVEVTDGTLDDPIITEFTFENAAADVFISRSSTTGEAEVYLRPGMWTVTATVDDDPWCDDPVGSCTIDVEVLASAGGLLAHYCMQEREGGDVSDSVGDNDGVLSTFEEDEIVVHDDPDSTWVPGCEDDEAGLNPGANNAFVAIAEPATIDLNGDFTIAATIQTEDESAGTIFAQGGIEEEGQLALFIIEGLLFVDVFEVAGVESGGLVELTDGECHRVAVVVERSIDGNVDAVQIYIDGVLDGEDEVDLHGAGEFAGDVLIGAGTYEGADFFNGLIDNVKIWNEALSGKGGILDDLDEPAGDCTILPADCPAMGEPDDGDSHCQNLEIVGRPDDDTEGIWEFEVTAADDTDDDLYYTLGVFQSTEDGDEDFSVTQFGEGFFEIRLSPGEYLVTARVDDSLFCDDEATDAACTAEFRFTADPLPDELVASFCLEDVGKGSDFTQEAISGLGADLIVHPEEKEPLGDGLPPLGVAGLDEGSATALAFDGLEDVMVLEPHVAFHVDRSYTIAMTIKPGEDPLKAGVTDPNAGAFFTIGPDLEEPADAPGVQILHVFDGLIFLSVLFVDEFTVDEVRVDDGEAHRVLMSIEADFEGELDAIAIYVDGELALEAEADVQEAGNWAEDGGDIVTRVGYGGFDYPSNDFESEVSNDRDINHFNGIIDNVKFWSYALGEDEAFADAEFPSAACGAAFKRGDANNDGVSNISDASFLFNFLFLGGPEPVCADAVDSNDDGDANISDASYLLNYLFLGGPPPPAPGALSCGTDPTLDELQCEDPMGVCL